MTRTVKRNTSDTDAHDSAAALLAAAATLDVSPLRIKTVSSGLRIDFSAPTAVYTEAGLPAGVVVPDDADDPPAAPSSGPATVTAVISTRYLGDDETSGDSLGWTVDITPAADPADPPRAVVLRVAFTDYPLETGTAYTDVLTLNNTGFLVRLTDTASGLYDEQSYTYPAGQNGAPLTLTIDIP